MNAWTLPKLGSIDLLEQQTLPDPVPAAGEVLLRLRFAALNPADRYLAEGAYPGRPSFPHVLGRDGIGDVVAIGANVKEIKVGDVRTIVRSDVGVTRWGTFAELVVVPAESLVPPPPDWTDEQAAAATLVYLTAWQALTQWDDEFKKGESAKPSTVLVTGASGGVGVATIQLARALGYEVIALSRTASKKQALLDLGSSLVLDPTDTQWRKQLGDKKVNLAIDNIGGELLADVISTLGVNGRVSLVGRLGGPVPQFNPSTLFFKRLRLGGVSVGAYTAAESRSAWGDVLVMLAKTGATPLVDSTFAFDDLPKAFARLKEGPMGKVVLRVR